jgi:tetratricopeptide (TPR) repeat protein
VAAQRKQSLKRSRQETNPDGSGMTKSASASEMTVEQVQKIVQLHNRGVGHLENHEWADAEAALSELQTLLPENVDAANNLAVSRTLSLIDRSSPYSQSKDPKAYTTAVQKANEAIKLLDALAKTDEQKAVAALIAGKQAAYEDSSSNPRISVALEHLRRAITLSGDRPQMWYALALAMEGHRDYSDSPELIKALQNTSELAPENLAVIGKLMEKQALGLNSKNADDKAVSRHDFKHSG